jgi:hypothetical protein
VGLAPDSRCQRIIPPPDDFRALNRGATTAPSLVQELEAEQAVGETLFEDGQGFGGGGHGGGLWPATTMIPLPWPGDSASLRVRMGEGELGPESLVCHPP